MTKHIVERHGYTVDLSYEHKTGCPRCKKNGKDRSDNNLHCYGLDEDGKSRGATCFSCSFTIPSEDWLKENGEESKEEEYEIMGAEFNAEIHAKLKENTTTDSKGLRGIRKETTTAFGVRHEINTETGEVDSQFYPCTMADDTNDHGYTLTGYKKRTMPKDFRGALGETGRDCQMFGQFRFLRDRSKYVLIVGGEIDMLSAYQMLADYQKSKGYDHIPVVSSTIGEAGCEKQVVKQYEWFNRFERIIVCMDSDSAGREAAEKVCKALPKGKAYIMEMSLKDPNEFLKAGKEREFISSFYKATPYTPSGIVGSGTLLDKMKKAAGIPKIPLPPFMYKSEKLMAGGIPLKSIVTLSSSSGSGKTTLTNECVYFWVFNSPHKVGVVTLESDCAQYGTMMLSRHISQKLDLIEDEAYKLALLNTPEVEERANELFYMEDGSHRWNLIDDRDGSIENMKDLIMQLIVACECKVIILDPLTDVLDGLSNEEQSVFMKWMKGTVKSHDVTFILINHVRKNSGGQKANSTGADLFEEDIMGSSSIFKSAACNLLFTRNKEHKCEIIRNIIHMKMSKCRWTGNTSPEAGTYYYDNKSHTLYDLEDFFDKNPSIKAEYEASQMEE